MKNYRLGLYEKSMPNGLSWAEKLNEGRNAGFDALELSIDESDARLARLDWSREERLKLRQLSRECQMPIDTMCLSGHRKYPLGSAVPETEARSLEIMEKALDFADDMGIRIIQLAGYDIYYDEVSTPGTRERFLQNLKRSTDMAASRGIILALETMENDFMNTVEKAMYYVNTINSPYLKVYPDVGNLTNGAEDVGKDLRSGQGNIAAAHLKETAPGVFRDMKFGEGRVDFHMAASILKELGVFRFTAEFWYDGTDTWRETLGNSNAFLRQILDKYAEES